LRAAAPAAEAAPARQPAAPAPAATHDPAPASAEGAAPRESLMSRARAVFRIGEGPTLAELTAGQAPAQEPARLPAAAPPVAPISAPVPAPVRVPVAPAAPVARTPQPAAAAPAPVAAPAPAPAPASAPIPSRFDAMMAALDAAPRRAAVAGDARPTAEAEDFVPLLPDNIPMPRRPGADDEAPATPLPAALPDSIFAQDLPAAMHAPVVPAAAATAEADTAAAAAPRALQMVATPDTDPAIAAMREEMARMRQLMETQMEQLSLERLRGSPARAAVLEALAGYGCEESLARAVAERIDPRLPVDQVQAPMLAELARMLTVLRSEPLEEGGVIALAGPTGAGKTTTAAKLAARFAARHRARDVALVTTDCQRPGAREQLQAHGRRLGITVCEAEGPERLQDTLVQLVD